MPEIAVQMNLHANVWGDLDLKCLRIGAVVNDFLSLLNAS
jgi:hypothetical protein